MLKNKYFSISPNLLPKSDPRYKKWHDSLSKRPPPWSKGRTKYTDPRIKKISDTFKLKKIDNFAKWRSIAREKGLIPNEYPMFIRDEYLSYLIGMVLGDGNIHKFPRTEKLTITLGTDKPDLISLVENTVEKVFNKKPSLYKSKKEKVKRITIYQKSISYRLEIPIGNKRYSKVGIPQWIWGNKKYLLTCLKGLYEAEASLCIHFPSSTFNFAFHNMNKKLLKDVTKALIIFGLHPEIRSNAIRLRKRDEVKYFSNLINFRKYYIAGSVNGRQADSESVNFGSNPNPAANFSTSKSILNCSTHC